jgi:hypothetical protein
MNAFTYALPVNFGVGKMARPIPPNMGDVDGVAQRPRAGRGADHAGER